MTIKPHLFYSSLIHIVFLAYIVSIPIYKGSLYSMSFGPYVVDLVSEGKPFLKSSAPKAPPAKAPAPVNKQAAVTKPEAPPATETPSIIETNEIDEAVTEDITDDVDQPPGITLIPEESKKIEPKKEPLIAKAEVPVVKPKPEPEKKPEPPKMEPVVIPPSPEPKPETLIRELPLPKDPAPAKPVEPKPSKVDTTEEPARAEFPVKPDEKAEDVSPSAKTAEAKTLDLPSETIVPKRKAEGLQEAKATTQPTGIAPVAPARSESGDTKVTKKTGKKTGQKTGRKTNIQLAVRKSEIASPAVRNYSIEGGTGEHGDSRREQGKGQTTGIILPNAEKPKEVPKQKPPLGIAVSDALFYRDIKIELSLKQGVTDTLNTKLFRKTHPSIEQTGKDEPKSIDLSTDYATEGKVIFSVAKADKGIYTFVMKNTTEDSQKTSLMIRLLEGKKGARNRKFDAVTLKPQGEMHVKFILPEGIFWDDETYFTGSIESSDSVTKFNDAAGIVWKENKE